MYIGIAILVAANPGAEAQKGGDRQLILWVGVAKKLFEFRVEFRQGIKENLIEILAAHFDFIEYLRANVAHGVGAPQEGDRAFQGVLP